MQVKKAEFSRDPEDWAPLVERVIHQWFYRLAGAVTLPMGIDVISEAIDILSKEKGFGNWHWIREGQVLVWENVPINHAGRVHAYVIGSKRRKKNTMFMRQEFWRMYFFEATLTAFDRSIIGRILAKPLIMR